ncbi:hypothetical protein DFH07DRAFT_1067670 [Mycena maculata]|uniref:Uncharacterized protein n=1 Tax=Mycena maculata TaxID=230809 RepID=A0AAD7HJ22_9AGAR|nr:hypothetical protein DFH07DRAFT_1067670 [Mycena maculata]
MKRLSTRDYRICRLGISWKSYLIPILPLPLELLPFLSPGLSPSPVPTPLPWLLLLLFLVLVFGAAYFALKSSLSLASLSLQEHRAARKVPRALPRFRLSSGPQHAHAPTAPPTPSPRLAEFADVPLVRTALLALYLLDHNTFPLHGVLIPSLRPPPRIHLPRSTNGHLPDALCGT